MEIACPRCRSSNRSAARYCARCGLGLEVGVDGSRAAGRVKQAQSLPVPPGYVPVADSAHLYYRWESSLGGGPLIGTEGLMVTIFNAGYPLRDAIVTLTGLGRDSEVVFIVDETLRELPRGGKASVEVPSYTMSEPMRTLNAALRSAEFADEK